MAKGFIYRLTDYTSNTKPRSYSPLVTSVPMFDVHCYTKLSAHAVAGSYNVNELKLGCNQVDEVVRLLVM
jgi:hypothetical protein